MKKEQISVLVVMLFSAVFMITVLAVSREPDFLRDNFRLDYEIDLKEDYVIVKRPDGTYEKVAHNELEEFLQKDNM